MTDREDREINRLLSVPAAALPGQVGRRTFLEGALAAAAAGGLLAACSSGPAAKGAATPSTTLPRTGQKPGTKPGILVIVQLRGGNDGLNTVVPLGDDSLYRRARGALAITRPLPISEDVGLHPKLTGLRDRFKEGKVAIVQGVGLPDADLSHFSSTARWMAATKGSDRTSGWIGRWLDDVRGAEDGLHGVHLGETIPLHMVGRKAPVTALGVDVDLWGSDRRYQSAVRMYDAVASFGGGADSGPWIDRLSSVADQAIDHSVKLKPMFNPPLVDGKGLVPQLELAARLINADLGTRVISCLHDGFDHHGKQAKRHAPLLAELDEAISRFYETLDDSHADQVTLLTFSEFGRRVAANGSDGTDHGLASVQFVIGDRVDGGLKGTAPDLADLNDRGDLKVEVDFHSVFASVLEDWLEADAKTVLGRTHPKLDLFRSGPR